MITMKTLEEWDKSLRNHISELQGYCHDQDCTNISKYPVAYECNEGCDLDTSIAWTAAIRVECISIIIEYAEEPIFSEDIRKEVDRYYSQLYALNEIVKRHEAKYRELSNKMENAIEFVDEICREIYFQGLSKNKTLGRNKIEKLEKEVRK